MGKIKTFSDSQPGVWSSHVLKILVNFHLNVLIKKIRLYFLKELRDGDCTEFSSYNGCNDAPVNSLVCWNCFSSFYPNDGKNRDL